MRSEVILVSYDTRMYRIGTANKSDKMRLRLVHIMNTVGGVVTGNYETVN